MEEIFLNYSEGGNNYIQEPASGTKLSTVCSLHQYGLAWPPLISHEVIVGLIAGTTTKSGLEVHAELDGFLYPSGIKVGDTKFKKKSGSHGMNFMANGTTGLIRILAKSVTRID